MNEDKRAEMAERSRVVAEAHVWQDAFCATISCGRPVSDAQVVADKALEAYQRMTRRDD